MSLGTIPTDRTTQVLEFPPPKLEQTHRSIKKIFIGGIVSGILAGSTYILSLSEEKQGNLRKSEEAVEDIGKIPGIKHIHLSK